MRDLEINHKLGWAEDETLSLVTSMREVPHIFGNKLTSTSSSLSTYSRSSLLALLTMANWEDPKIKRGLAVSGTY